MKLPDKFKFTKQGSDVEYTASTTAEGISCIVTWPAPFGTEYVYEHVADVTLYLETGAWTILSESFPELLSLSEKYQLLISEKKDASELAYAELKALRLTCGLINRLLDDR